jgi:hypothetical protein
VCYAAVGPLFFAANTITGVICLDMLEGFCFSQLDEIENPEIMFQ